MKPQLYFVTLVFAVLCGCRSVSSDPTLDTSYDLQESQATDAPVLSVEVLDLSIPLGDSFPVAVEIQNAPPQQNVNLEVIGSGVTPSITTATVTTDASGNAELRLSGRAARPKLNSLDVIGYFEDGNMLMGSAYVNFEPADEGALSAQARQAIGEPTTIEEYFNALPVATNQDELEKIQAGEPPAVILDDVVYHTADGTALKPLDAVVFNSPTQITDTQLPTEQKPTLQAAACPPEERTSVRLTTAVSGSVVNNTNWPQRRHFQ